MVPPAPTKSAMMRPSRPLYQTETAIPTVVATMGTSEITLP